MGAERDQMLSHYRLVEKIGQGGMGVVWRAEDTVLSRTVAIKVLPADLALEEARRKMFLDEARLAASVSHGNIVQVHELGRDQDLDFIVMEFVEGLPLNKLLRGKPLPSEKVTDWGLQVAQGLARAHRKGLIHRDLKPANILITPEGEAKIVDFGLATLFTSRETTGTRTVTAEGETPAEVVGTLPYMSPEQVRGHNLDARSDVFSLGSVLYEMTTGQRPFQGTRHEDIAAAIIRSQPIPVHNLVRNVPLDLHRIIEKTLARSPEDRYQTTDDLAVDLKRLLRDLESGSSPSYDSLAPIEGSPRRRRLARAVTLSGILLVGLGGLLLGRHLWIQGPRRIEERLLTTNPVDRLVFNAQISPDGRYLAYEEGDLASPRAASLRVLSTGEVKVLAADASVDGWFPDGTRALLTREPESPAASMWIYSVLTGESQKLRDKAIGHGVSPNGRYVAFMPADEDAEEIWVMDVEGGQAKRIVARDAEKDAVRWWVTWSPDSRRVAYRRQVRVHQGVANAIESCDLDGNNRTRILEPQVHLYPGIHAIWLAGNRILFSMTDSQEHGRDSNLWKIDIDTRTWQPRGHPRKILAWPGFFAFHFSTTEDGRSVAFVKWRTQTEVYKTALDATGDHFEVPRRLTMESSMDTPLTWMPDGRHILFRTDRRGTTDIFICDLETGRAEPFLAGPSHEVSAWISPDGEWLLYGLRKTPISVASSDSTYVMRMPIQGGPAEPVMALELGGTIRCGTDPDSRCVVGWEDEGKIRFAEFDPVGGRGRTLGQIEATVRSWALAPDGTQIMTYTLKENGDARVDFLDLETGKSRELIPVSHWQFYTPAWSPKGDCLYASVLVDGGGAILRIALDGQTKLLSAPGGIIDAATFLIPSRDGTQFAFAKEHRESSIWMLENP